MGLFKTFKENNIKQASAINVHYSGGYPDIPGPLDTSLLVEDDYLGFMGFMGKTKYHAVFKIPLSEIININLESSSSRSSGKTAVGAIVGGALAGGVGAVAGAAVGAKSKDTSKIVLTVIKNNIEYKVYFSSDNPEQNYNKLSLMLNKG